MKTAIAIAAVLLLAACNPPKPPAPTVATPPAAAPDQAAAAPAATGDEPMHRFRAFGTEPFWNVNVEDATLTYTTPEDQAGVVMQGTRRALEEGVELSGSHDGKPFVLTVSAGLCSDGMSDNRYTLVSAFRYGDIDYKGCGEVAK